MTQLNLNPSETSQPSTPEGKVNAEEATPAEALSFDDFDLPVDFDKDNPFAGKLLEAVNTDDPKVMQQNMLNLAQDFVTQAQQDFIAMNDAWQDELTKDSQYGGPELEANLGAVSKRISEFASLHGGEAVETQLREQFDLTGAGNAPLIVKFMIWQAKELGEGTPLSGTPAGSNETSRAQSMFGT